MSIFYWNYLGSHTLLCNMAQTFPGITDELEQFIRDQHLFFVASAPLSQTGHINVSPKGLESLQIVSPHHAAYLDLTGSGNETSAHLQENSRITLMFCSFTQSPRILRLYGKGNTVLPESEHWRELYPLFPPLPGARQIIMVEIERVQTSCGFGVPLYEYQGQRDTLVNWANKKGKQGLESYRSLKNQVSIDGLATPLSLLQSDSPD